MNTVKITTEQVERAKALYSFGELKNSITKGESNIFGAIGEIVVFDFFTKKDLKINFNSTYDYDLTISGYKVDVKTKKFSPKFNPSPSWMVSVSDTNTTQDCEYYFFVGVSEDYKTACLYGYLTPNEFYIKSKFGKKGDIDPKGNGVWTFKGDCYNLEVSELNKFN